MESLGISHQTLSEFVNSPFETKNETKRLQYESRYLDFSSHYKIKIESAIEFEQNYFLHIKVPSESQKGDSFYDVVVQFFTPNEDVKKQLTLSNYYVQFFSNSPGFVYKYASLYKLQGYLIESLCDKFEIGVLDVLPDKTNNAYELWYDSSIYYACRYILDNRTRLMGKINLKTVKKKSPDKFFNDIQDIEESNLMRGVSNLQKTIRREIKRDAALSKKQEDKLKKNRKIAKDIEKFKNSKQAGPTTIHDVPHPVKKLPKMLTAGERSIHVVSRSIKKKPKRSTHKK